MADGSGGGQAESLPPLLILPTSRFPAAGIGLRISRRRPTGCLLPDQPPETGTIPVCPGWKETAKPGEVDMVKGSSPSLGVTFTLI